jgi:hypothetical protein
MCNEEQKLRQGTTGRAMLGLGPMDALLAHAARGGLRGFPFKPPFRGRNRLLIGRRV